MKYSKKVCAHDKVIVVLNANKDKYFNYETSINGYLFENVSIHCHDIERLNSIGARNDSILMMVDMRESHIQRS